MARVLTGICSGGLWPPGDWEFGAHRAPLQNLVATLHIQGTDVSDASVDRLFPARWEKRVLERKKRI